MPWSAWIEIPIRPDGTAETTALSKVPPASGVYAIAGKHPNGMYNTRYVGRSRRNVRERLRRHLTGHGNIKMETLVNLRKKLPMLPSFWVAYLETKEPSIVEAVYLDSKSLPTCNLIRARLPAEVAEALVWKSELED